MRIRLPFATPVIARNRPEPTLAEIARSLVSTGDAGQSRQFVVGLRTALDLESDPLLSPSGRAALYYLLRAQPHQRVYLPAYTCWVVAEAARLAGREVHFLDIEYPGLHLKPAELERISRAPGAVVLTHQFGWADDARRARAILGADHFRIEDCAGALGARFRDRPVGLEGDAAIFSFEAGKMLGCGGGAVTIRDASLREQVRKEIDQYALPAAGRYDLLILAARRCATAPWLYAGLLRAALLFRAPTSGPPPDATSPGAWYRRGMGAGQVALGLLQLRRLEQTLLRRRRLLEHYHRALDDLPALNPVPALAGTQFGPIRAPVLYAGDKFALHRRLLRHGIDLGFSFSYCLANEGEFPGAARFAREVINLPLYSDLLHADRVVAALRSTLN